MCDNTLYVRVCVYTLIQRIWIRQKGNLRSLLMVGGGGGIDSRKPFSARMIWRKGWIEKRILCRMDALKNGWSSRSYYTPNHHPLKIVFQILFFKTSLPLNGYIAAFKCVPPTGSDDLCLPFCLILIVCFTSTSFLCRLRAAPTPGRVAGALLGGVRLPGPL